MLTLNIVHTNYGNHHLFVKGNLLYQQLSELSSIENLRINVLFNGYDTYDRYKDPKSLPANVYRYYTTQRLTHGMSLQYLLDESNGWCISIDEDDEFHVGFVDNLKALINATKNFDPSKLYTYEFDWSYISPRTGYIHVKRHPLRKDDGEYDAESIVSLSNWNLIYNIDYLRGIGLRRPNINQFDDVIWYHYLYLTYKGEMTILPIVLINYHKENATLSRNENLEMKEMLSLIVTPEVFKLRKYYSNNI